MPEIQNRRRNYLINKVFQYKFIFNLVFVVILTVAVAHILATSAAKLMSGGSVSALAMPAVPVPTSSAFPVEIVWISSLATVILGTVLALAFGLFYSHRIAGPLFNLKRVLAKVGGGDLNTQMHIRAKDEFHDVEEAFNQMMAGLNGRYEQVRKDLDKLPEPHRTKACKALAEGFLKQESERARASA